MKSWSISNPNPAPGRRAGIASSGGLGPPNPRWRPRSWLAVALLVAAGAAARAQTPQEGLECLQATNLRCAQQIRDALVARSPNDPDTLRLQARTLFHEGRYDEAAKIVDRLEKMGEPVDEHTPYRETAEAALGLRETTQPGVRVRVASGVEQVLNEEAVEVLQASRRTYDRLFGGGPDHDIVLDIFPTGARFTAASGLPPDAVRTTGVVALSKWNRLLLTSPRALSRGYAWKDTIAHEYIHLVVAWRSGDQAPVWLQEGLAKHLEGDWRGGRAGYLSVHQQGLLARALKTDKFVPFEKFRRSMAYLDSGEEAALAFAQVATMVHYLLSRAGDGALPELMDRVRAGQSSEAATAELAGYATFDEFRAGWEQFIATLPLVEQQLAALPVVLDGEGDDFSSDPLLSARVDLVRFVRVGDLLREANRPRAALVEYEKALDPSGPPSPTLLARKALCLEMLGQRDQAVAVAEEGAALYPEFPMLQVTLARLRAAQGQTAAAVEAWKAAHDLNPFDPEVQKALQEGYTALGEADLAARHARYGRLLATGGVAQ